MPKIILSKHALERARSRKMDLYPIERTIIDPDQKISLGEQKFKFLKNVSGRKYQLVATYIAKEDKWLIISAWVRGEEDRLPFIWTLITAPFRLLWWLLKTILQTLWQIIAKLAWKK